MRLEETKTADAANIGGDNGASTGLLDSYNDNTTLSGESQKPLAHTTGVGYVVS